MIDCKLCKHYNNTYVYCKSWNVELRHDVITICKRYIPRVDNNKLISIDELQYNDSDKDIEDCPLIKKIWPDENTKVATLSHGKLTYNNSIKDINKELHEEFNFILNDPEEYE